ncbi:MAG TPA: LamG-like jellyroll fold domain-containing protein, partial [Fimbriiglobus sp.]|nr:LamG-like jellyroll fold domain-containing protein [Fimbriiglobus sp.]
PFRASTTMAVLKRVCEDDPRPVREANPEVPDWLAEVIGRLHAKDPAARYQSAAEVAEVLGRHLAHLQHPSVVPLPITVKPAAPLPVRRRHRWVAVAAVLALATAGLGLTEAAGVTKVRTTVIRFLTPDGTLVVETDDPDVKITIEGDGGLVITGAGPQEVRVRPGVYTVRVSKDGTPLKEELISITRGGKETVRVRREPPATAPEVAGKPVLRMRFDRSDFYERDGRTYARDLSGRGNDGLCEQARFTSHGKTGGGLENAGKGYLRLPSSLVAGQSNFTIAAWVKFLDSKKNWTIYTCMNRDYPAKVLPEFDFYHTHCMYVGAWCPPRTWIHVNSPEARIAPGEWAFVAVTLENGAPGKGQARLILNDRVYEKPLQHVGCSPEGVQDIAALNLNGVMDELTVWPRALTEQELRQLFASVAVTPIDHAREANAQLAKGRLDEAAEEFSKVLDTTADSSWKDAEPKRILAQIVTSDEVFPRVVKLRPKVIWLWSHRAHHLAEQGRWDEAEMGFRTRLELGGDGAGTWHNYAVASLVAQHPDTYRQVCETMLKTFEEVADPHEAWWVSWALALAPHSVKDKEKASRFAERAMKGLPNIASGSYPYAAWLYRLDRLDDSVDCWNKAGKADIEDVRLCFLAMAHHRLGNADLADRFARQARSKKADWAKLPTWYRRAYCELLLNEMEKVVSGKPD